MYPRNLVCKKLRNTSYHYFVTFLYGTRFCSDPGSALLSGAGDLTDIIPAFTAFMNTVISLVCDSVLLPSFFYYICTVGSPTRVNTVV